MASTIEVIHILAARKDEKWPSNSDKRGNAANLNLHKCLRGLNGNWHHDIQGITQAANEVVACHRIATSLGLVGG